MRLLFGQKPAPEMDLEPAQVDLPPRRVLRARRPVREDVREDEDAAVPVGPQLEAKLLTVPVVCEQVWRVELGDDRVAAGRRLRGG